ncbi:phosphohydrolase [Trinickia dabaoshanensis]|uniref:Phosphohydrolase n=1 Tax=Trinickia dabaoshanensis TaxID=564714 RepID=A0A2N7VX83_9BURK|nr:phosphohydrolase [Trinickia dabaoshanensis]PMS21749.1 phosphohydrolase [Trinickia dabaoshanensis]
MRTSSFSTADEVVGVRIPRTPVATAAASHARAALPIALLGHACRVFVFAMLNAQRMADACDADLLYVCAMYANFGLTQACAGSMARYEVDGADAARAHLDRHGVGLREQDEAWLAIALHMTPGIASRASPLANALAAATLTDLTAAHLETYTHKQRLGVLAAYPRGPRFADEFIAAMGRGMAHRPDTAFGTVGADVLDRVDPNYLRLNFCGQLLGSPWEE